MQLIPVISWMPLYFCTDYVTFMPFLTNLKFIV